jgi:hypothetical protein
VAVNYQIPPWLAAPADPAAHYGQGLQIGVRIGAEQAAQRYQQQQMLRAQAQDEFERQYKTEVLNLQVDQALRKQRAQMGFQAAVQQGMNPMEALMAFGPEMGESMGEILRAQGVAEQRTIANELARERLSGAQRASDLREREIEQRSTIADRTANLRERELERSERNLDRLEKRLTLSDADRERIKPLQHQIDILQKQRLELDPNEQGNKIKRFKLAQEAATIQRQIDKIIGQPSAPAPAAAPQPASPAAAPSIAAGTIVKQGGKRYRFNGGDSNDPANYSEIQ